MLARLKFLVQSVYDVLPSPVNLFTGGKKRNTVVSTVCRKRAHYECLSKGIRQWEGYRWRHDQVLRTVADTVDAAIRVNNYKPEAWPIYFVQAGECPPSACKINSCLLSTAQDWQWGVDIGNPLKVPEQIATTTLRPDLILWSTETKQVLLIELTVPWEENIEVACERKLEKYQELVEQCKVNKWRTSMLSNRSWLPRFCGKISMQSSKLFRDDRRKKEKGHQSDFRVCRKSIEMVMD